MLFQNLAHLGIMVLRKGPAYRSFKSVAKTGTATNGNSKIRTVIIVVGHTY